jgi:hypothetical protein
MLDRVLEYKDKMRFWELSGLIQSNRAFDLGYYWKTYPNRLVLTIIWVQLPLSYV